MAGDWIKMRTDLAEDPAVIAIAAKTELDEDTVVGKLHRLWSWADRQSRSGHVHSVTQKWLDGYISVTGFAQAMVDSGWLRIENDGISFPNFDRHNGQTAKTRALASRRQAKKRVTQVSRSKRDKNVTREEKRRDKRNTKEKFISPTTEQVAEYANEIGYDLDPDGFVAAYEQKGWRVGKGGTGRVMTDWKAAVRVWKSKGWGQNGSAKISDDGSRICFE